MVLFTLIRMPPKDCMKKPFMFKQPRISSNPSNKQSRPEKVSIIWLCKI